MQVLHNKKITRPGALASRGVAGLITANIEASVDKAKCPVVWWNCPTKSTFAESIQQLMHFFAESIQQKQLLLR